MGDYSVKAILSAADKGFTSTIKGAQRTLTNLGNTVKSGLGMGVLIGIGQQAFSSITGSVKGLMGETMQTSDAMAKLKQAMEFSGQYKGLKEIEQITGGLKNYADKTVFELQDVMSTFGALSANGIKDADKMTQSVGNAVAVFGGGAREFSSVGLAFSQAMASGALHAQDWNQILNASPQLAGGLRKELIKLNPAIGKDFKGAMEDGMISADLLGKAMNNIGMTDFAKEAAQSTSTFEGAMGNMKASAVNGMMGIYEAFAKSNVVGVINKFNVALDKGFTWIAAKIPVFIKKVSPYWKAFSKEFTSVAKKFGSAFKAIGREFKKLTGAFGSTESLNNFKSVIGKVGDALKSFAGFLEKHANKIAKFITMLPKLWLAFHGFKIVSALVPGVAGFGKALLSMAGKGISGLAGKLFGISKGQEEVGKKSKTSGKQMLTAAKSFALMGVAVLLVAAGFALLTFSSIELANAGGLAVGVMIGMAGALVGVGVGMAVLLKSLAPIGKKIMPVAQSMLLLGTAVLVVAVGFTVLSVASIALANSGGLAIGVMVGMVAALAGLGLGMAMLLKFLAPMSAQLIPVATSMLLLGAAVVVVAAGFAILAATAIILSNAGGLAIGVMAGLVLTLAGLMALAAYLAPMLTAGAVGFIAFSAALLTAGVAALLVSAAIAIIATTLPIVAQYGLQASVAFLALGGSLAVFGAGALVAGAGAVVLGTGLLVVSVAVLACAVGMAALAAGTLVLGVALLVCATSVTMMAASFPMAAAGAMALTVAFTTLLAMSVAFGAASIVAAAGIVALSVGALAGTASIVAFGLGMTAACVGVVAMGAALKAVKSSMKSIASSAKTTKSSLNSMTSAVKFVSSGLDALGNKAKSAMNKLTSAFSNAAKKATESGKQLGNGFTQGMQSGLSKAPAVAILITTSVSSALRSGRSAAYSAGAYISQGFAQGMRSQLAIVRSAAAQLAAAADKAVRAKAKIHSPSKVADKLGEYWVAGFANSLADGAREVWKAAENLVSIPSMDLPEMRLAYAGELSDDYEYYRNAEYTIIVKSEIDGKEVGRTTAKYTEEELNKRERRNRRKKGKV